MGRGAANLLRGLASPGLLSPITSVVRSMRKGEDTLLMLR